MRRTYRSKKDTGGVIDRRDLLLNLDEKSSAYDAFFIQNIKQTKRELSCIGSSNAHGVASNRVRKRKYVKRIVKEVETPCRESLSRSAYLTPDKSIRVNKPMDPFDILLNSSPAFSVKVSQPRTESVTSKVDMFDKLVKKREGKTYTRKKPVKPKKVKYSSSESTDSDKENSDEQTNVTRNTSDIKAYQLLIENDVNITPKRFNDSINNIVNNLSILNKLKHKNSFNDSMKRPLSYYKNRLTRNIQSPILQKSPLCSTPFKVKYRGESIYKFSPISITNDDNSPKYTTVTEDNDNSNNSIVFLANNKTQSPIESKENARVSTVDFVPNNSIKCDKDEQLIPEIETNIEEVFHKDNSIEENDNLETLSKSNATPSVEISSFQTTEFEPFLGFSNNINKEIVTEDISLQRVSQLDATVPRNNVTEIEANGNSQNLEEHCQYRSNIDTNNSKEDNNTSLESVNDDKDSLYDTCTSDQSSIEQNEIIKEPIVQIQRMNDSSFLRYYEKMNDFSSEGDESHESSKNEGTDECNNSVENEETDESNNTVETDECNNSIENEQTDECNNSVETDECNNSIDECNNIVEDEELYENNLSQEDQVLSQDEQFASFEDSYVSNGQISESGSGTDVNVDNYLENEASDYIDIVSSNDDDGESNEEEKCISFVTTRRRNEITNNSVMSIFDDSCASSSTDCDKTVLSINRVPKNETIDENVTLMDLNVDEQVNSDADEVLGLTKDGEPAANLSVHQDKEDTRISFVTTRNSNIINRKSSRRSRNSSITSRRNILSTRQSPNSPRESMTQSPEPSRKTCFEKPGIVLQPGKKWERSLSIYRRMTMMTDHFDQSVLEDEPTDKKGRKYRQSVICTMEMQELNGSLHNESINSRRSTFISKPSRSTIRIVKDPDVSRLSLCNTTVFDDLKGKCKLLISSNIYFNVLKIPHIS